MRAKYIFGIVIIVTFIVWAGISFNKVFVDSTNCPLRQIKVEHSYEEDVENKRVTQEEQECKEQFAVHMIGH